MLLTSEQLTLDKVHDGLEIWSWPCFSQTCMFSSRMSRHSERETMRNPKHFHESLLTFSTPGVSNGCAPNRSPTSNLFLPILPSKTKELAQWERCRDGNLKSFLYRRERGEFRLFGSVNILVLEKMRSSNSSQEPRQRLRPTYLQEEATAQDFRTF